MQFEPLMNRDKDWHVLGALVYKCDVYFRIFIDQYFRTQDISTPEKRRKLVNDISQCFLSSSLASLMAAYVPDDNPGCNVPDACHVAEMYIRDILDDLAAGRMPEYKGRSAVSPVKPVVKPSVN